MRTNEIEIGTEALYWAVGASARVRVIAAPYYSEDRREVMVRVESLERFDWWPLKKGQVFVAALADLTTTTTKEM